MSKPPLWTLSADIEGLLYEWSYSVPVTPAWKYVGMAIHKVTMRQNSSTVVNTDVEFSVIDGGKKLGELHISKGGIEWFPNNARYSRVISWKKFAEYMDDRKIRKPKATK